MPTVPPRRHATGAPKARRAPLAAVPGTIERSDRHAQNLWRKTRTVAMKTYGDDALARRLAFSALKGEYERRGNRWVRRDLEPRLPARPAAPVSVRARIAPKARTTSRPRVSAPKKARPARLGR